MVSNNDQGAVYKIAKLKISLAGKANAIAPATDPSND